MLKTIIFIHSTIKKSNFLKINYHLRVFEYHFSTQEFINLDFQFIHILILTNFLSDVYFISIVLFHPINL